MSWGLKTSLQTHESSGSEALVGSNRGLGDRMREEEWTGRETEEIVERCPKLSHIGDKWEMGV